MAARKQPKLAFHVQHLLGIGHLVRAHRIAAAAARAGFEVVLLDGGRGTAGIPLPPGIRRIQLPPATTADLHFTDLLDAETGKVVDDRWYERRRKAALDALIAEQPDILLVEGYPFARRKFAFELDPLIEEARKRGIPTACSIRDILIRKSPEKTRKIAQKAATLYDAILVHGDENFCPLDASFAEAKSLNELLVYTGYVAPEKVVYTSSGDAPKPVYTSENPLTADGVGEVVISCGGGAVGGRLLQTAIAARAQAEAAKSPLAKRKWRLLIGPNLPNADREAIAGARRTIDSEKLVIEPARTDFTALLSRAVLSISQAGYNTVCDLAVAGTPSVLVPFEGPDGRETEQPMRARLLEKDGWTKVVSESELSSRDLLAAMEGAFERPRQDAPPFAIDGAARTARELMRLASPHSAGGRS